MVTLTKEQRDWLDAHRDDPIVKRAWLLAEGKGDKEDMRDHIQDLKNRLLGIGKPLPYNPERREVKPEELADA